LSPCKLLYQSSKKLCRHISYGVWTFRGTLSDLVVIHNKDIFSYQEQIKISTPKDPIVRKTLKNKINDDKANILKNIESIKNSYQAGYTQIHPAKSNFENLLYNLPEKEREYLN
jgi:hypothetical protein